MKTLSELHLDIAVLIDKKANKLKQITTINNKIADLQDRADKIALQITSNNVELDTLNSALPSISAELEAALLKISNHPDFT